VENPTFPFSRDLGIRASEGHLQGRGFAVIFDLMWIFLLFSFVSNLRLEGGEGLKENPLKSSLFGIQGTFDFFIIYFF